MNSRMNWVTFEGKRLCHVLYRHCGNAKLELRLQYLCLSLLDFKNGGRQVTEKAFTSK